MALNNAIFRNLGVGRRKVCVFVDPEVDFGLAP